MALIAKHLLVVFAFLVVFNICDGQGLKIGYYRKTCPKVEAIVKKETTKIITTAPTLAAPLLIMHFHDCFVRGCDGSVLLNSTRTSQAEKDAIPNLSLRGFRSMNRVKSAVEKRCPSVVSCADILALVARDVLSVLKGPFWKVPWGRKYEKSFKPPTLQGTENSVDCENWLEDIEKLFESLNYTDDRRVRLFFPISYRKDKGAEFASLQQGQMNIEEYVAKFTSLLKFAPHIAGSDEAQADQFINGLNPDVFTLVNAGRPNNFVDALNLQRELKQEY
ncbi:peroxidase 27-like [Henckelia pumila]|uniref:peroxidase 27-like n=1 Tax=Henckelia pumila TaxID=405737 RepID=UPI003C6E655E